jgi:hypothetical protein
VRVAVHQPQYLPWLGYFDKMDRVDCLVLLDDVQFETNDWQNRSRIKTATGWQWLTVPVRHRFPQPLAEVRVDTSAPWRRKHLAALVANYRSAPAFDAHRPFFETLYAREWGLLLDVSLAGLTYLAGALGIATRLVRASTLGLPGGLRATERLVEICRRLGADTYLSGAGARAYLELERFGAAGIAVPFQAFACPVYPQRHGAFQPDLSVVDLLFNCGKDSLAVLRGESGR